MIRLTDEEIRLLIAKEYGIPHYGWEMQEFRAIADAASDKAYLEGQRDLAKECIAYITEGDPTIRFYRQELIQWLKEKGLL